MDFRINNEVITVDWNEARLQLVHSTALSQVTKQHGEYNKSNH